MISNIIIGIVIVFVCMLPFILVYVSRKGKYKKILASLNKFAAEYSCEISEFDHTGSLMIGIDNNNKIVFFVRTIEDKEIKRVVKLNDMQSCRLINSSRSVNEGKDAYTVVDRLELRFVAKTKEIPDVNLVFFNTDEELQLNDELKLIEKWDAKLKPLLTV